MVTWACKQEAIFTGTSSEYKWDAVHSACRHHRLLTNKMRHYRSLTLPGTVFVVDDQPGQTKISDLAHLVLPDQNVCGPDVAVDVIHSLDVRHASRYLQHNHPVKLAEGITLLYSDASASCLFIKTLLLNVQPDSEPP